MSKLCQKFEAASVLIGKRWVNLIVFELLKGPKRFNDLESVLEISSKMLSSRLKELEEEDILVRNIYPETPIRIEYELTEKGKSLESLMKEIESWSQKWYQ
jgi:DNA-binding HxlR family transcriptional regulator